MYATSRAGLLLATSRTRLCSHVQVNSNTRSSAGAQVLDEQPRLQIPCALVCSLTPVCTMPLKTWRPVRSRCPLEQRSRPTHCQPVGATAPGMSAKSVEVKSISQTPRLGVSVVKG